VLLSLWISIGNLVPFSVCPCLSSPPDRQCCTKSDIDGVSGCEESMHELCGACCCCCCMFADNQMRAGLLGGADTGDLAQVRNTFAKEFFVRAVLCCPLGRCGYYSRARNAFRHKVGGGQPLQVNQFHLVQQLYYCIALMTEVFTGIEREWLINPLYECILCVYRVCTFL
jgi:hypothetical protein